MYLYHFGLSELPFMLTPNTGYYCALASHQEALATLVTALKTGEGFIKVVGEVGTGKTLLCRKLLNELPRHFVTAYLPNPDLPPHALRLAVATELGITGVHEPLSEDQVTAAIQQRLLQLHADGHSVVLLVDEAQALTDGALEVLRLFTNLETERRKLLQVVLFGQPELDQRLSRPHLRQLRQRITFSYRLRIMKRREVEAYVRHRLQVAGASRSLLAASAMPTLARLSHGVPRLVNVLCHKALLLAFGRGLGQAGWREVMLAAWDTEATRPYVKRQLGWWGGLATAVLVAVGSYWL